MTQRTHLRLVTAETGAGSKRGYNRLTEEATERLKADIRSLLALGEPGKVDWRQLASKYDVSLRTVENRVQEVKAALSDRSAEQPRRRRVRHPLPGDTLERLGSCRQYKKVWLQYRDSGDYLGDYTTFIDAVNDEYGRNTVMQITKGSAARHGVYLKQPGVPFMARYTIDLFSLRAPLRDLELERPAMACLVREPSTGTNVFSWVFDTDAVTSDMILAVLAEAIRGRTFLDEGVFVGGLPDTILCDNGSNFTAEALNRRLRRLGVRVETTNSYRSQEAGAHERAHRTARSDWLATLPGSSDGQKTRSGALIPDPRPRLTLAQMRHALERWAQDRNLNVGDDDMSPFDRWRAAVQESQVLPRRASDAEVAPFFTPFGPTCMKYAHGVRVLNEHYSHPELRNRADKRYTVRLMLRDPLHVALFTNDGRFVCIAKDAKAHDAADAAVITNAQAADEDIAAETLAQARELAAEAFVQWEQEQPAQAAERPAPRVDPATPDHLDPRQMATAFQPEPAHRDEEGEQ